MMVHDKAPVSLEGPAPSFDTSLALRCNWHRILDFNYRIRTLNRKGVGKRGIPLAGLPHALNLTVIMLFEFLLGV